MRLILFAFLCALGGQLMAADAPRPNIVYLLVDDLGHTDVGFTGSKDIRTPNIDKLAKEGAVLDSFYVQPVCSPTRAALLTGRYATHTGVYSVVRPGAPWGVAARRAVAAASAARGGLHDGDLRQVASWRVQAGIHADAARV